MRFSNSSDQLGGAETWEISLDLGYEESLSLESQGRSHADGSLEDYGVAFAEIYSTGSGRGEEGRSRRV